MTQDIPTPTTVAGKRIAVGNLTRNVKRPHIEEIFGLYGKIVDFYLPLIGHTGIHKNVAFLEYENEEAATKAMDFMNGAQIDGRLVTVEYAERKAPLPERTYTRVVKEIVDEKEASAMQVDDLGVGTENIAPPVAQRKQSPSFSVPRFRRERSPSPVAVRKRSPLPPPRSFRGRNERSPPPALAFRGRRRSPSPQPPIRFSPPPPVRLNKRRSPSPPVRRGRSRTRSPPARFRKRSMSPSPRRGGPRRSRSPVRRSRSPIVTRRRISRSRSPFRGRRPLSRSRSRGGRRFGARSPIRKATGRSRSPPRRFRSRSRSRGRYARRSLSRSSYSSYSSYSSRSRSRSARRTGIRRRFNDSRSRSR